MGFFWLGIRGVDAYENAPRNGSVRARCNKLFRKVLWKLYSKTEEARLRAQIGEVFPQGCGASVPEATGRRWWKSFRRCCGRS